MNPINDNHHHHQEHEEATPPPAAAAASRCIFSETDMQAWRESPQKQDLLRVVAAMGKSCASSQWEHDPNNPLQGLSPAMASLHGSLSAMQTWLNEIPPVAPTTSNQIRFGNPAFQQWHVRLKERSLNIVKAMYLSHTQQLSVEAAAEQGKKAANSDATVDNNDEEDANDFPDYLSELACYLQDAFGHPVRLDYGTGHESSFMIVLYGICKLGWMDPDASGPPSMDKLKAATLAIFHVYLQQTRQLQTKYKLEPAGSHGVWGLDDYHCLPFYFGACQLAAPSNNNDLNPQDITVESQRQQFDNQYLYFGCMQYICTLKQNAPLWECSPMLYDISQTCPTWQKVASGLLKLYDGEVLSKRQVVQHFTFGSHLFVAHWTPSPPPPQPPSHQNFRETTSVSPMVRAPWASLASSSNAAAALPRGPSSSRHTTTASENDEQHDHPTMPPPSTKAPWAK